jgi:3-methyladenine DNA glycosylase AlkD
LIIPALQKMQKTYKNQHIIGYLRSQYNARNVQGMARYGINSSRAFGVSMPLLRALAKDIGKDHALAMRLWKSGIHEARILSGLIAVPSLTTEALICDIPEDKKEPAGAGGPGGGMGGMY